MAEVAIPVETYKIPLAESVFILLNALIYFKNEPRGRISDFSRFFFGQGIMMINFAP
jgi:hypothetical protein